jgi:transposase
MGRQRKEVSREMYEALRVEGLTNDEAAKRLGISDCVR